MNSETVNALGSYGRKSVGTEVVVEEQFPPDGPRTDHLYMAGGLDRARQFMEMRPSGESSM